MSAPYTTLDQNQILQRSFDQNIDALQVTSLNQLVSERFDSIYASYPNATTEIYTYQLLSSTVATVTVIYTDATKQTLVSVVRS